jgi:transposase-like protein
VVKIRESGSVVNKAPRLVIGVDTDGYKQVLGIWIEQKEGSRFWLNVLTSLRNRGLKDALVECCDCEDEGAGVGHDLTRATTDHGVPSADLSVVSRAGAY